MSLSQDHKISLETSNGDRFLVSVSTTAKFGTVQTLLRENMGQEDDYNVPLSNIDSATLPLTLEFSGLEDAHSSDTSDWITDFFTSHAELDPKKSMLKRFLLGADFMDYKSLYDACTSRFAQAIEQATTPEEIYEILGVPKDYTKEQEEKVLKDTAWWKDVTQFSTE